MKLIDHLLRRYVVYPLHDRRHQRRLLPAYKESKAISRLSPFDRDRLSWARFQAVLEICATHVPYYREAFNKAGVRPSNLRSWNDLTKLPLLSKQDILSAGDRLISKAVKKETLHLRQTGGSTGPAMRVYYDTPALDAASAVDKRNLEWMGYWLGERIVHVINRDPIQTPEQAKKEKVKLWAVNYRKVLIDRLDDEHLATLLDELNGIRAHWLNAYPSVLFVLAQYAAATGKRLKRRWGAVTTGETLFESQRESIQKNLGIEIFNRYGSAEFGVIAHECTAHGGLHVNDDHVHVELVPVEGQKDAFEILVTTLTNHAMPLVRYKTADLCYGGIDRGPCACGLTFPRLKRVEGRIHDVLFLPNGGRILSSFLQDTLLPFGGIRQFQLVQNDFDSLEFHYIPNEGMNPQVLARIQKHLHTYLGEDMKIAFLRTDSLPTSREGKLRYTIQTAEFRQRAMAAGAR